MKIGDFLVSGQGVIDFQHRNRTRFRQFLRPVAADAEPPGSGGDRLGEIIVRIELFTGKSKE